MAETIGAAAAFSVKIVTFKKKDRTTHDVLKFEYEGCVHEAQSDKAIVYLQI